MALIGADPRSSVLGKPPRPHLELPKDLFQCSSRGRKQMNFPRRFTAWSLAVTEEWRLLFKVSKTDVNPSCLFPSGFCYLSAPSEAVLQPGLFPERSEL